MGSLENVTRWVQTVDSVRADLGVSPMRYSDAVILALIHVESAGDPEAHRDGSQFHGLLQMGNAAGQDVGLSDRGRETTAGLHGQGEAAIRAFLLYQERYSDRHDWVPSRIAAMWKGGPGTARSIDELIRRGRSIDEAIQYAELKHGVPNLVEYVRRFRAALQVYAEWCDDENKPYGVCSPQVEKFRRKEAPTHGKADPDS